MDTNCFVQGMFIHPPDPNAFHFMDDSHYGWGAHLKLMRLSFHGHWMEDKSQLCINILEIMAIHFALKEAIQYIHHSCVMISTDNTTVVSYINKQGGTHSPNLCIEVWEILHWCLEHDIVLRFHHIPGISRDWTNLSIQNALLINLWRTASFKCSIFPMWICLLLNSVTNSHCMYLQFWTIKPW